MRKQKRSDARRKGRSQHGCQTEHKANQSAIRRAEKDAGQNNRNMHGCHIDRADRDIADGRQRHDNLQCDKERCQRQLADLCFTVHKAESSKQVKIIT